MDNNDESERLFLERTSTRGSTEKSSSSCKRMKKNEKVFMGSASLVMLILLGVGAAGAIGHLLYYRNLNGRTLSSVPVPQEWNLRIGTILAFIAKTSWTVAITTAQAQQVWRTVGQKPLELKTVDAMLMAPTDFSAFRRGSMIAKAKMATLLALVAWLIPISTIFAPATLTVVANEAARSSTVRELVPDIDFNTTEKFASLGTCAPSSCGLTAPGEYSATQFRSPNAQTVVQIVASTSSGRIQSMVPRYPNSTYTTSFFGPLFQCSAANSSTVAKINAIDQLTAPSNNSLKYKGTPFVSYYAFVPGTTPGGDLAAVDFAKLPTTWSEISNATVPTTAELWIKSGKYRNEDHHVCEFYNSTFDVEFSFSSGKQLTAVKNTSSVAKQPYVIAITNSDAAGHQVLSYQAVFTALARQLIGRFESDPLNTQLFQTPVVGAREFGPYFDGNFGAAEQPFKANLTIPQVIEQLSQNITLSMLASSVHAGNGTSADITVYDSENVYYFDALSLIVTYAVTLAVAVACVGVGLLAVAENKGTRTTAFSALVYAARQRP
ncbi:putative formylmethionine deformylase-like [Rosellinia necatrix]|uniref:Putative formylmethionine deformylase-like n=1 Tax=Rosellinia necatrix TaxID=77044 RepID=A0A1S7ULK3_ROSNE|nr:putative formylmethionine deformylase-like [Rosellinia necatrix]